MKPYQYRRRVLFNREALRGASEPSEGAGVAPDGEFHPPADGWYQIAPAGEHPHATTGLVQVLDPAALESIARRFETDAALARFPGALIDFDHFSYDSGKSSAAAGWITRLEARPDGLWAQVRWTAEGQRALSSGSYRFISPVWLQSDTESAGPGRVRPLRLDSAGLTNHPNLKGMVPLSNRRLDAATNQQPKANRMQEIARTLELPLEASEDAIRAEIRGLRERLATSEAGCRQATEAAAPLRNRVGELEGQIQALTETVVEADLNRYAPRFRPESRDKWKAHLLANRAGALELLDSLPEPPEPSAPGQSLLNRAAGKAPVAGKDFPSLVSEYMANHQATKSQAVDFVLANHREAHEAWLRNGGGAL